MNAPHSLDRALVDVGELIAEHKGPRLEEYARYADDPVGFIEDVLGDELTEYQKRIAVACLNHPLLTIRSCHAAGKDWLAGRLALWWTYARRGLVILTGPTRTQVEEILTRGEIRTAFVGSGLPGELHVRALRPGGRGGAGILAKTASGVSSLTGFHDSRVLFIITEAQDPDIDHAWDAAFACTTGSEDRVLTLGNPTEPGSKFHRAHQPGSDWHRVKIEADDIPNVREGRIVVPGLLTREGVERIRREYGESSPYYVARVLGEFPETATDSLVRQEWLEAAVEAHREEAFPEDVGAYWTLGVDVARHGPDATVVCLRRNRHVVGFREWRGADTMETARRVHALARDLHDGGHSPVQRVVVDVVGVGGGVFDKLAEDVKKLEWLESGSRGSIRKRTTDLVAFNAGEKAANTEKFRDAKAEAFWYVRGQLEEGEIALPDDEDLLTELRQTRVEFTADGKTKIESKRKARSRLGGGSPDRADALVMSFKHEAGQAFGKRVRWSFR